MGVEPGCDSWKLSTVTITLHSLHKLTDKMSYLNQMHEKGNGSIRKEKKISRMSLRNKKCIRMLRCIRKPCLHAAPHRIQTQLS